MLVFNKALAKAGHPGFKNVKEQFKHVQNVRKMFNNTQRQMAALHGNGAAIIPQDVYREFDNVTIRVMRENNHTLMNDLMPLARSLPVGKVEHIYRRASDSGIVVSSLGGKTPQELDKAEYDYDKSIKVIHQTGFGRGWMEVQAHQTEAFDGLVDDSANAVRAVQDAISDHIYNGVDVTFDGTDAYGILTSSKPLAIDLGASGLNINFATSSDSSAIRNAWIGMVDQYRNVDNNLMEEITFYVSQEIMSNFQKFFSTSDVGFGTIYDVLVTLRGVATIKEDASLSGNQVVGCALNDRYIRPLVGMGVNTVPVQRLNPFDDYNFITWANVGLEIRTDFAGRVGVGYARTIS